MSEQPFIYGSVKQLPTELEYQTALAETIDEYGIEDERSLETALLVSIRSTPGFRQFHGRAQQFARSLEPLNERTGIPLDPARQRSNILYAGLGFGALLLPQLHGDMVELRGIFEQEGEEDSEEYIATDGEGVRVDRILKLSADAIDRAGASVEGILHGLEDCLVPEVPCRRYFRVGCGVLMAYAYSAHATQLEYMRVDDLNDLKQAIEHPENLDWDAELRLLNNDT